MTSAIGALPRFPLLRGPSPYHPLERLGEVLGGRAELWIKREDLLPLAFGGNKLRNLEYLVGAARAAGADTLVTAGRRWSNHCRLTAAAGARAGMAVHLVLSGPPAGADDPARRSPARMLGELLGAAITQLPTDDRSAREAAVLGTAESLRLAGRHPYVIPVGGSGIPGAVGQVLAAWELLDQVSGAPGEGIRTPDAIVLPTATGGTQAGILAGLRARECAASVHGVLVARGEGDLRPAIEAALEDLTHLTGVAVPPSEILLDGSKLGDGYGRRSATADEAAALLARTEGILVDPIYTAKGFAGFVDGIRSGRWDGRTVAFWHAGGTPGLFEPLDGPAG